MSWDTKTLLILAIVWGALSLVYLGPVGMMPGARAWGTGAIVILAMLIAVWYAERRGRLKRAEGKG